ncbi:hypothetical protein [Inhella proteolytica]|uniref:Uncharacterized protein n=1 Tax=Inhella proteolytica TaxID=2795029 RepID=A0A931J8J0_9BURK|nr:hypothetical protein [Inhella proteolytica]MBH9578070.1 hypothetical protein [Inhella proteolytica]
MHADLARAVDAAFEDDSETDLDELLARLGQAIAAAPQDRALRQLRLRLSEAIGLRELQIEDLSALVQADADDLQSALTLALHRHRWAGYLAAPAYDGNEDEELDDAAAEAAAQAEEAQRLALEQLSLQELRRLAQHPKADADFVEQLLQGWQERVFGQDWSLLAIALRAGARWPEAPALRRQRALAWASLAHQGPDFETPDERPPVGFAVDYAGGLHDPALCRRAHQAVDAALAAQPQDAELLDLRARLHLGLSDFAAAAQAFEAAAQTWRAQGDEDAATESADWARRCAAGRSALSDDLLGGLEEAVARLGQGADSPPRSEAAAAFLAEMNENMARLRSELEGQLAEARPAIEAENSAPSAEELAELEALAQTLAPKLAGLLAFEPLRCREAHPRAAELHPRLAEFDAQMQQLGFERLAWIEIQDYSERFGAITLTGVWPHPSGEATLLSTAVAALQVSELETEFSDGRQLITSQSRGRNYFGGGPQVDVLFVDASLPLEEVIELHRARVAHELAHTPGLALRPWKNAADFIAAQERQRQAKLAYRLAVGKDGWEARSVPVKHPEVFVPLMREAALAYVRDAQARHAGSA